MNAAKSSPSHPAAVAPARGSLRDQVVQWLQSFESHVRDRRYEEARALFSQGVLGFGTLAYTFDGLASLEQQWREIWANSSGFHFDFSDLRVFGDGTLICAAVPWRSVGYDATGAPFLRPGRATVVLSKEGDRLLAVHTHFSLAPGVAEKTYPPPPAGD